MHVEGCWIGAQQMIVDRRDLDTAFEQLGHDGIEGEVLVKVGKPDSESIDSGGGATVSVKRWIYLPAYGDDQTMTTIVIKNGKVTEVTRTISR
jgi:hypothetical protein